MDSAKWQRKQAKLSKINDGFITGVTGIITDDKLLEKVDVKST